MKKIAVIGSLNIDFVVNVETMPAIGETLLAEKFELIPGGKGANQACALGRLGADVCMLGAVGNDMYAKIALNSLRESGVDVSHMKHIEDTSTGIALITVNREGNNSIIVVQGANQLVDRDYIDQNMEVIQQADLVIFQLEIPLDTVIYAAQKAKEFGKTVILDPAPAPDYLPVELLKHVDYIKPNETELAKLTNMPDAAEHLQQASELLKHSGVNCVLVTLGGDGVFANLPNGEIYRAKSEQVEVVDTTAAGDSFVAGIAVSLAEGKDIISAIDFANQVSAVSVTRKGAQSSIPSRAEVESYIRRKSDLVGKQL